MPRMRDRRLPALTAAALLAALLTGARLPAFLFVSTGVLLVLSWFWTRQLQRQLDATLLFTGRGGQVGERLELRLQLENRGPLPLPWIAVDHPGPAPYVVDPDPAAAGMALPPGRHRLRLTGLARRRGHYRYGPVHIRVGDGFGLFFCERRVWTDTPMTILPPVLDLQHLPLPLTQSLGEQRRRQQALADPTRVREIRPWRPGDDLRHVHWRTTARKGALHVRSLDLAAHAALLVCLDLRADAHDRGPEPASLETAVQVAASVVSLAGRRRMATGLLAAGSQRRFLQPRLDAGLSLLAALAAVEADGREPLDRVLAGVAGLLPARCALAVVTPAVTPALAALLVERSARSPVVVFRIDPLDGGPAAAAAPAADGTAALRVRGIPVHVLSAGDDLRRLGHPAATDGGMGR